MRRSLIKFLSFVLIFLGFILIINVGVPVLTYEVVTAPKREPVLLSPLPSGAQTKGARVVADTDPYPLNLTKAHNWFSASLEKQENPRLADSAGRVKFYTLSIPSLGIENASVEVAGDDLKKSLIHYEGTTLPGQLGNAVVFGHSTLPQLFDSKNYLSIFSNLPQLEKGEKIFVDWDGVVYTYEIFEKFEVKPSDVWVLEQNFDDSFLSLITCVPPGTYFKRLVVKARLVPPSGTINN